jgi:hypothetical protein
MLLVIRLLGTGCILNLRRLDVPPDYLADISAASKLLSILIVVGSPLGR